MAVAISLSMSATPNQAHARLKTSRPSPATPAGAASANPEPLQQDDSQPDTSPKASDSAARTGNKIMVAVGKASYYGNRFHGKKTADGGRFNKMDFTAAHRTLPFGTTVQVTNLRNGKSVIVTINDRGPYHKNRIIDLSKAAARELDLVNSGIAKVRIEAWN